VLYSSWALTLMPTTVVLVMLALTLLWKMYFWWFIFTS